MSNPPGLKQIVCCLDVRQVRNLFVVSVMAAIDASLASAIAAFFQGYLLHACFLMEMSFAEVFTNIFTIMYVPMYTLVVPTAFMRFKVMHYVCHF